MHVITRYTRIQRLADVTTHDFVKTNYTINARKKCLG